MNIKKNQDSKTSQRQKYWSLMLVGDDGRIIPFRRFKGIAATVIGLTVLAMLAVLVLGIVYVRQGRQISRMREDLEKAQQQAARLRDEKDVLLAQLVVSGKLQPKTESATEKKSEGDASDAAEPESPPTDRLESEATPPGEPDTPEKDTAPESQDVELAADIRQFEVTYAPERSLLQASFRIYNVSRPKVPLSGRIVVVFKKQSDSPIRWLAVPSVQLKNGKPGGSHGQAFSINNYRTMQFKAFGQKPPISFDTASVFVFSAKEDLLLNEDFGFKIDYRPPPEPDVQAAPEEKTPPQPSSPKAGDSGGESPAPAGTVPEAPTPAGQAQDSTTTESSPGAQESVAPTPEDANKTQGESPKWKPQPSSRSKKTEQSADPQTQGEQQ